MCMKLVYLNIDNNQCKYILQPGTRSEQYINYRSESASSEILWRGRIVHTLSAVRALSSGSNQEPQTAAVEAVQVGAVETVEDAAVQEAVEDAAVQEPDTYNQTQESIAKKNLLGLMILVHFLVYVHILGADQD